MVTINEIKGRLLLELYERWCFTRFGSSYQTPSPTYMKGFENYLEYTLSGAPSTNPLHEAWEAYLTGQAAEEPLSFEPEPELPRRRSRRSPSG